jgi:hypothetical protein
MRGLLIALIVAAGFAGPAAAADAVVTKREVVVTSSTQRLPFPRTERAQAAWNERACWSECGSHTTWAMADCLKHDAQGICLDRTDHADRACLRNCRTSGGPYLPDIFDF